LLQAANRLAEAEPLARRAVAIDEKSLPTGHPNVACGLNNLALLLYDTNRLAEAEPLACRALVIVVKSLGAEHPYSQRTARNYAGLLKAKGLSQEQATQAVAEVVAAASQKSS